ncbi:LytTR family DNA-binding domain-containing protein [Mycoplasmatota bacterium WC30]
MKISVVESKEIEETEVIIKCKSKDNDILEIEKSLTYLNRIVTGKIAGRNYTLTPNQIYYFDSIDNKVFAYTKDQVYDINLKLYQLEDIFHNTPFIRINKSTVLNTRKIQSFSSSINGRMEAVLKNKERVIISRKYVPILRNMLGGK